MENWSDFYGEMVDRNIGVVSNEEQERLRKACVAVAGCGGMGGLSAEQLVRLGVGHIKIADFDNFETHNLSRQCGSTSVNVGQQKAQVLARHFQKINPELNLEVFTDGVNEDNVDKFIENAEVVIDGIDYSCFYNTVVLHRAARSKGLCVISPNAIGFGANILVFGPNTTSIEEYVGLSLNASRGEIEGFTVPIAKFAPYLPTYADPEVARKAALGKISIPNIAMPQYLGASVAVSEAVMMVLGRVKPPLGSEPRVFVMDLQDRKFEVTG